jgi:hypothetical protein
MSAGYFPLPQLVGWRVVGGTACTCELIHELLFRMFAWVATHIGLLTPARFENESLFTRDRGYHGEVDDRNPDIYGANLYD